MGDPGVRGDLDEPRNCNTASATSTTRRLRSFDEHALPSNQRVRTVRQTSHDGLLSNPGGRSRSWTGLDRPGTGRAGANRTLIGLQTHYPMERMVPPVTDDEQNLSIRVRDEGDEAVLEVGGELDPHTATELTAALKPLLASNGPDSIVLDLQKVAFMDSSGLRSVLAANDAMRARGARRVLRSPSDSVRRLLEITDLLSLLDVEQ